MKAFDDISFFHRKHTLWLFLVCILFKSCWFSESADCQTLQLLRQNSLPVKNSYQITYESFANILGSQSTCSNAPDPLCLTLNVASQASLNIYGSFSLSTSVSGEVDGAGFGRDRSSSDNLFFWHTGDEMHLSKGEN